MKYINFKLFIIMSSFIFSGGKIVKTRETRFSETYNKIRREHRDNPNTASYFYPPPIQKVCKRGAGYNCFVEPKPVVNPSSNPSTPLRVSNIVKNFQCYSKIQYANASEDTPFYVNYLGRTPGQPGGGGSPPTNRLR